MRQEDLQLVGRKITSKMDAYSDIDIADEFYNPTNNYYVQVDAKS